MTSSPTVPPTRREDVVDDYHGTPVPDPYRWLESGDSPEVVEWVETQNALTAAHLDRPERARWHERLVALMQLPLVQGAQRRGDDLFSYERPSGKRAVRAHPALGRRSRRRSRRPRRPGDGRRRCRGRDRLVRGVRRRFADRRRHERRRRRAVRPPRDLRHRRLARRQRGRRDPEHQGVQHRVGTGRLRLLLHPLPRGRRVQPHRPSPPDRQRLARRPRGVGRPPRSAGVGGGGPVTGRPVAARRGDVRLGPHRHPRPRPHDRRRGRR